MSAQHYLKVDRAPLGAFPPFDRNAAALARARRARQVFQDRLVDTFRGYLEGVGAEPSDSDLRTFALLAAAEYQLEEGSGHADARVTEGHKAVSKSANKLQPAGK